MNGQLSTTFNAITYQVSQIVCFEATKVEVTNENDNHLDN